MIHYPRHISTAPSIVPLVLAFVMGAALAVEYVCPSRAHGELSQITTGADCGYSTPQLSADGQWLLAMTDCLDGIRKPGSRLVRVNRALKTIEIVAPSEGNPQFASMSGDGTHVVFLSEADLVPGENPDLIQQLFLSDETGRYRQLTRLRADMPARSIVSPQIANSGKSVVFCSDADLIPGENADGNLELFLLELPAGRLSQATHTIAPAVHQLVAIGVQDRVVVFVGNHPMKEAGTSTTGRDGLYLWDRESGEVSLLLESPVGTVAVFGPPVLALHGHQVIFHSPVDFIGENPDRNDELFQVDVSTLVVTQLTHTSRCMNVYPSVSGNVSWVLFISTCSDPAGRTSMEANIVALHLPQGEVLSLTKTGSTTVGLHPPTIDEAGRVVAFAVNAELPGMMNSGHELQIITVPLTERHKQSVPPSRRSLARTDVTAWIIGKDDPKSIYLGTRTSGILRSRDEGRTWQLASYRLGDAHITGLVEGIRPDLLYAGTAKAGIYRSIDGGKRWLPVNDGLEDLRITALAIDPEDPTVLYAQTPTNMFRAKMFEEEWQVDSRVEMPGDHQSSSWKGSVGLVKDQSKQNVQLGELNDGSAAIFRAAVMSNAVPILLPPQKAIDSVLQIPKNSE